MSRRLEVVAHWAYRLDDSDGEYDDEYIVTKKEGKFYITDPGKDGPFLKSKKVEVLIDWLDDEYCEGYPHCNLEEVELKLIDGDKIVSSTKVHKDWRSTMIYLMNLL